MSTLRVVLCDQLSPDLSSLRDLDAAHDVVVMAESADECRTVPHHKQKLVLILSAMRHFAAELEAEGLRVDYTRLDESENAGGDDNGGLTAALARAVALHAPGRIVVTEPSDWRARQMVRTWTDCFDIPVEQRDDDRFFCSRGRFARWAGERKSYRMEFFYREMRRDTGLLMESGEPVGGRWNFDAENRKRLPASHRPPTRLRFEPDAITRDVMGVVARRFADHFGDLEPFRWAVTRGDAVHALEHFIGDCLPAFGDYQDAMKTGAPLLYHAVLSPYLNIGLLTPREVCAAVEAAYRAGTAPLNAVEGFIRQILGWREYVRGLYGLLMPGYATGNALAATRPLPAFYWTGATDLNCMAQVVGDTRRHAYAHHIQRLMVTGNFALLAGIAPAEIEAWYLAVYADAFDWVELPNTHGMAIFADGGLLASKPYAASGAYIDRMSDYCAACRYQPKTRVGPDACPFTLLYWDFLDRNRPSLGGNPRLALAYRALDGLPQGQLAALRRQAASFLDGLADPPAVGARQASFDL